MRETVIRFLNLLLTRNLSWGLIKHSPNDPTVSTVSFYRIIPFFSGLLYSIEKIRKFIQDFNYTEFEKDDKTLYAVIRAIEIIGEATKKYRIRSKIVIQMSPGEKWRG